VLLAVVKAAFLFAAYYFWHPSIHDHVAPALRRAFGVGALHFPAHVLMLGGMFQVFDLAVTIILFPLIAWSVLRIGDSLQKRGSAGRRLGLRLIASAPNFLLVWIVFAGGWKGLPLLIGEFSRDLASPNLRLLVGLSGLLAWLTLQAFLVFAPAYVALGRGHAFSALAESRRHAAAWTPLAFLIVATAWAFQLPFQVAVAHSGALLGSVGGESVLGVLLAQCGFELVALVYMFSAATRSVLSDEAGT